MSNFTQRVTAGSEDGYKPVSGWTTGNLRWGRTSLGVSVPGAIRITGVTIPAGATIDNAYLKFTADGNQSGTVNAKIAGIDEDNTSSFSSDPTGRSQTTAQIDWDVSNLTNNTEYTSPDIKTIIQEIVDRGGWSSGNAMGFLILDDGTSNDEFVDPYTYEDDPNKAMQLVIDYTAGGSSPSASVSPSVSTSPSASPSLSPSTSVSPSVSTSPSVSPSVSVSPSPVYYGLVIKRQGINKHVEAITDPKETVFTTSRGVLGFRATDEVTTSTDASGNINTTDNHSIGYTPIAVVTTTAYDGSRVTFPCEWHSYYLATGSELVEVTERFNFKIDATKIRIIVHAEYYNHTTFAGGNLASRSYTFDIYYYFNELVETV